MKKPKFKFLLHINETVELFKNSKVENDGSIVADSSYTRTDYIDRPNFKLPNYLIGESIYIAIYENLQSGKVYSRTETIQILTAQNNNIQFIEGEQSVIIYLQHKDYKLDKFNFTTYTYATHPVFSSLIKETSRESSEMYMRSKLKGNLSFKNGAFDKISSLDINNSIVLEIQIFNYNSNLYDAYYQTARFTKLNCKFDYDKRQVEPNTEPDDQYTNVLSAMNDEYDLVKLHARTCAATYSIPALEQYFIPGGKQVTNVINGTFFNADVDINVPDGMTEEQYLTTNLLFEPLLRKKAIAINLIQTQYYMQHFSFCVEPAFDFRKAHGPNDCPFRLEYDTATQYIYFVDISTNTKIARTETQYTETQDSALWQLDSITMFRKLSDNTQFAMVTSAIELTAYYRVLCKNDNAPDDITISYIPEDDPFYSGNVYNRIVRSLTDFPRAYMSSSVLNRPGQYSFIADYYGYFTNIDIAPRVQSEHGKCIIPVCPDSWAAASLWTFGSSSAITNFAHTFRNGACYTIFSAISAILAKVAPEVKLYESTQSSEFFYGAFNPINLEQVYPLLTHLSNIEEGVFLTPAQKLKTKLRDLFDLLKNALRCYWFIDDDNVMHIEHITWFLRGGTYGLRIAEIDTTSNFDVWNKKILDTGFSSLSFSEDELYKRLVLSADEDTTEAYANIEIDFLDEKLRNLDTNEISIGDFRVNIDYIFATADDRSDGIVFMLAKLLNTQPYIDYIIPNDSYSDISMVSDGNLQYSVNPTNTYAMPKYLAKYYEYDFPGNQLSNIAYTTLDQKLFIRQKIRVPLEHQLPKYGTIMTRFGLGIINSVSIDIDSQYADIELLLMRTDYITNFDIRIPGLQEVYNRLNDTNGTNVFISGSNYYTINDVRPEVRLSSSPIFPAKFTRLLTDYFNGFEFETNFRIIESQNTPQEHRFIFHTEDTRDTNEGIFLGISYGTMPMIANQFVVQYGFLEKTANSILPTGASASFLTSTLRDISIRLRMLFINPNTIRYEFMAASQGYSHIITGDYNLSDVTVVGDAIAICTRNYIPNIIFNKFVVKKR